MRRGNTYCICFDWLHACPPIRQVLSEAVEADEPLVAVEDMDEGGRLLLEELLERQVRSLACGPGVQCMRLATCGARL